MATPKTVIHSPTLAHNSVIWPVPSFYVLLKTKGHRRRLQEFVTFPTITSCSKLPSSSTPCWILSWCRQCRSSEAKVLPEAPEKRQEDAPLPRLSIVDHSGARGASVELDLVQWGH